MMASGDIVGGGAGNVADRSAGALRRWHRQRRRWRWRRGGDGVVDDGDWDVGDGVFSHCVGDVGDGDVGDCAGDVGVSVVGDCLGNVVGSDVGYYVGDVGDGIDEVASVALAAELSGLHRLYWRRRRWRWRRSK